MKYLQTFFHVLSCVISGCCLAVALAIGWYGNQAYQEFRETRQEIRDAIEHVRATLEKLRPHPFRGEEPQEPAA